MARTLPRPIDAPDPLARDTAELGALVRNRRAQNEMRIDDTADAIGVSKEVLSRLENGRSVGLDKLFKVLDGLGLAMVIVARSEVDEAVEAIRANTRGST